MPDTRKPYNIPSAGDVVVLDVPPRVVGLYEKAQQGDLFTVVRASIDDGGLYLTVTPRHGDGETYRLSADHVAPHDGSF